MKLSEWRKAKNISQAEFAEIIGVSGRVTIARYEAGDRLPERSILAKIIKATDGAVTANDWFEPDATPTEQRERA